MSPLRWSVAMFFVVPCLLHAQSLAPKSALSQSRVQASLDLRSVIVLLKPGVSEAVLPAQSTNLGHPQWWRVEAANVEKARMLKHDLEKNRAVQFVQQDQGFRIQKDQFVPNDTYYFPNQPASPWPGQWYLNNTFVSQRDLRVVPAWNRNLTGQGVFVGVIDDGFDFLHPDLSPNYAASSSFDFAQNDSNVFPVSVNDNHGTALLGLICGRGGNSQGITGVAPFAVWAGIRADMENAVTSQLVSATLHRSSGSNTTLKVKNHSYGPTQPWVNVSSLTAALATSTQAGTIHVRSAGNFRGSDGEDANKFQERNTVDSIVVSAMGSDGKFATYSNFGASVFCTAPSGTDASGALKILTTDRVGAGFGFNGSVDTFPDKSYTSEFGGTSVSAALVSGAMVLAKQAQPSLDVRFAKHVLARTSDVIDAADATLSSDAGWRFNSAGFRFNQNYGFGLINVDRLTSEAQAWARVTPLTTTTTSVVNVNSSIPDGNTNGVSRTATINGSGKAEEVVVTLNVTHPYIGDLEADVISPSGTRSRLFIRAGSDDRDNISWTFSTNAFWGESVQGTWIVRVKDVFSGDSGTWNSFELVTRQGELERDVIGQIVRSDWTRNPAGEQVTLEFEPVGGGSSFSRIVTLNASGQFSLAANWSGDYNVSIKPSHWLRKRIGPISFSTATVSGLSFSLVNGDVNNDNEVGPADFAGLAFAFGTELGDPNYNVEADLDGNDEVGPADFAILANNFGQEGD